MTAWSPGLEACDDGNQNDTDACRNNCELARCATASYAGVEGCDDGNEVDTDAPNRCARHLRRRRHRAASGLVTAGNREDADACLNTCALATCGDGRRRRDLQRGIKALSNATTATQSTPTVAATTASRRCGDSVVRRGEDCDDGGQVQTDACLNSCRFARCGGGSRGERRGL